MKEDAITWGFELPHKPQGKAHHPKRQVTRKMRNDCQVSVELWYSLDPMRVFILGVGATGSLLAKLLIRQGHEVLCGDRDPVRARAFLGEHSTLVIQRVNARNPRSIVKAAKGCHLLVNACPAVFNKTILRAAIRLRAHYIDTASHLIQSPFRPEQHRFDRLFREKNRLALIHAGAAPGLTNLLAMQAAAGLDTIERVQVRLFEETASDNPVSQWSADDSFDEAVSRPRIYRNGRFEFGERFGERELFRFPRRSGRSACCWPPRRRLSRFRICSGCARWMPRSAGSIWNDCAAGIDKGS